MVHVGDVGECEVVAPTRHTADRGAFPALDMWKPCPLFYDTKVSIYTALWSLYEFVTVRTRYLEIAMLCKQHHRKEET